MKNFYMPLIFCSRASNNENFLLVIKALISDYDAVFCSVPQNKPVTNTLNGIKFKDHSNKSINAFNTKVAEDLKLFHLYDDFSLDDKMKILFNIILNAYNSTCKIREKIYQRKSRQLHG